MRRGIFKRVDHAVVQHGQRAGYVAHHPPRQDRVEILVIVIGRCA